jgi:hypothetical protein
MVAAGSKSELSERFGVSERSMAALCIVRVAMMMKRVKGVGVVAKYGSMPAWRRKKGT